MAIFNSYVKLPEGILFRYGRKLNFQVTTFGSWQGLYVSWVYWQGIF